MNDRPALSPGLQLEGLAAGYDGRRVLQDLSLQLADGEIGVLLGESGSGKSTLLRLIAGFETPDSGRILLHGEVLHDGRQQLPAHRRGVGMVFQDHALFPHLNVADNIAFGLSRARTGQRRQRVAEMLDMIGLAGRGRDWPHQLSGGQQQRVAMARALAPTPRLLLLDEPFASLDRKLRERMAEELRSWLQHTGTTSLMVTHDVGEAFTLGDRLGVIHQGRLRQWDDPQQVWRQPADHITAELMGDVDILPATSRGAGDYECELGVFQALNGPVRDQDRVGVVIRAGELMLSDEGGVPATVESRRFRGHRISLKVSLPSGARLAISVDPAEAPDTGQRVALQLVSRRLPLVPWEGNQ